MRLYVLIIKFKQKHIGDMLLVQSTIVFISTVGFSNEVNCCQSEEIGKSFKEKLLKSIFRVDQHMLLSIQNIGFPQVDCEYL